MAGDQESLARLASGELRELLRLIDGSDIEELELEVEGTKLHLKRAFGAVPSPEAVVDGSPTAERESDTSFVVAERVGFFHYGGKHGATPPTVGDEVTAGQVLGVIDSLSVSIPVPSPCAGVLEEVLVEEGQPVEYGQPLFVVQATGSR